MGRAPSGRHPNELVWDIVPSDSGSMAAKGPQTLGPVETWVRGHAALAVLRRVVDALAAHGVQVLPVKGVVTARLLYDDVSQRALRDIDVRVTPRDLRRVVHVASELGWTVRNDSPHLHEAVLGVDGWEIDVECSLGQPGLCAITIEEVISRAEAVPHPFPHLEPELHDHALLLVLNAFKDGLRHTPWSLEDLRRIARSTSFRPDLLAARAREGGVRTAVWIVADWLADRQGAAEWSVVRDTIGPTPPSDRVLRLYRRLLRDGWPQRRGVLAVAVSNDRVPQASIGLLLVTAGLARRRLAVARSWLDKRDPR